MSPSRYPCETLLPPSDASGFLPPIPTDEPSSSSYSRAEEYVAPVENSSDDDAPSLPPAHSQLLSSEPASFEVLKGYDHALPRRVDDVPSKLAAMKERGGGSWLLGFARLIEKSALELEYEDDDEGDDDVDPPLLVRDDSSLESEGDPADDDDAENDAEDDGDGSSSPPPRRKRLGVSFSETVTVRPVPHSCDLSPAQRDRMFTPSYDVRRNKIRNKKEYRYDGCDWRNVTEEWEMAVDMVTGELVHPAHEVYVQGVTAPPRRVERVRRD